MIKKDREYRINNYIDVETKNGDLMAKLQLIDTKSEDKFNCVIWADFLAKIDKRALKIGNIISVIENSYNEKYNNVIIREIQLLEEASIGLSEKEREELFVNILEVIDSFQDQKLKTAISEMVLENEKLFKVSPAARTIHHNYVGGLMQHTWECVEFAKIIFSKVAVDIDQELVLAGCIMHDTGKMFEYIVDLETGVIERNKDFEKRWISHIHFGFSWANERNFPELAHIIASHHGIKDYGALVEPASKEADLVHEADMLSSRLGKISLELCVPAKSI